MSTVRVTLCVVLIGLLCALSAPETNLSNQRQAQLERLVPPGYEIVTTAEGDFDGDGVRELAISINDAGVVRHRRGTGPYTLSEDVRLPARVMLVKPAKTRVRVWRELPIKGGVGFEAEFFDDLRAVDLTGDGRPELLMLGSFVFGGEGIGRVDDVYVWTYRSGSFERIWSGGLCCFTAIGYCDLTRAFPGHELIVVDAGDAFASTSSANIHWSLSVYGCHQGEYRLFWEQNTKDRYSARSGHDQALGELGAKRLF